MSVRARAAGEPLSLGGTPTLPPPESDPPAQTPGVLLTRSPCLESAGNGSCRITVASHAAYAGPIVSLVHPLRKLFSAQRPLLPSSTACASEAGSLSAGCRVGSHGGEWGEQALSGLRPEPVRPTPWASPQGRGTARWSARRPPRWPGDRPAGPLSPPVPCLPSPAPCGATQSHRGW